MISLKVRIALWALLLISFINCIPSHRFSDRNTKVDSLTRISFANIDSVSLITVGLISPSFDKTQIYPIDLSSRPDSINSILRRKLSEELKQKVVELNIERNYTAYFLNAIESIYGEQKLEGQKARFALDSFSIAKANLFKKNHTRLIFIFRLQSSELEYSSPAIIDYIFGSVILVQNEEIAFYRQFRSVARSQRRFFPKGSEDRENFPHFPQWQIEKVVDALVDDLKKRVQ